jgi:D-inositol-3-phosphate glycosyltransferase
LNSKKIALISFHTCPNADLGKGKAGGMNVYVRELSRSLGALGLQVDIFTRCHEGQESEVVYLANDVRLVHLHGGPVGTDLDTLFTYLPEFIEQIAGFQKREGAQYQVVHSHYWLSGCVGRELALEWNVPHVVSFHTLARAKMQARAGEKEPAIRVAMEGQLAASAQQVVCSSHHEKEALVRLYGVAEEFIEVVPCGVDLSLFRPLDEVEARKRLGLNGEKVILYVGRIEPLKGLELLWQVTAMIEYDKPFKLLIIGGDPGTDGEVDRLKHLAQLMGIGHALEFVGRMDQKFLPLYYSAADVCVVPSYYESFSLVALEAMACGTPVIACRVGGLPTVVQHGLTGYLHPWRCPEPFADSVEVILSSRRLRMSMGEAARERAVSMGWEKVADRVHRLYLSLAKRKGSNSTR